MPSLGSYHLVLEDNKGLLMFWNLPGVFKPARRHPQSALGFSFKILYVLGAAGISIITALLKIITIYIQHMK